MKLVLATGNGHKVKKLSWIFNGHFDEIVTQDVSINIDESGASFLDNARIKAREVSKKYGCFAAATDGGVLIPSLGDSWDALLTKRFIGHDGGSDFDRMDALIDMMKGKKEEERDIVWNEAIAVYNNGRHVFSVKVEGDRGRVQDFYDREKYQDGIWQCSITYYPQFDNKNFFDLTEKEQEYAEISWHRLKKEVDAFFRLSARQKII